MDYSRLQVKKIVVEKQIDPNLNITLLWIGFQLSADDCTLTPSHLKNDQTFQRNMLLIIEIPWPQGEP